MKGEILISGTRFCRRFPGHYRHPVVPRWVRGYVLSHLFGPRGMMRAHVVEIIGKCLQRFLRSSRPCTWMCRLPRHSGQCGGMKTQRRTVPWPTLNCVCGKKPWFNESVFSYRSLRLACKFWDVQRHKNLCNANAAGVSDTPSLTGAIHLRVWLAGTRIHPGSVSLLSSSLNSAAAGVTTLLTIVVAVSGRR
jgi:hypothetical protein